MMIKCVFVFVVLGVVIVLGSLGLMVFVIDNVESFFVLGSIGDVVDLVLYDKVEILLCKDVGLMGLLFCVKVWVGVIIVGGIVFDEYLLCWVFDLVSEVQGVWEVYNVMEIEFLK